MKTTQQYIEGDDLMLSFELARPDLKLDLTTEPWNMPANVVPVLEGIDIIHSGRFAPDGGRNAIFTDPPAALGTITTVWACNLRASVPLVHRGAALSFAGWTVSRYSFNAAAPYIQINYGGTFDAAMVGATVIFDADGICGAPIYRKVIGLNVGNTRAILSQPDLTGLLHQSSKFVMIGSKTVDMRGLMVSDGRRFYIYRNAAWTLWYDLGSDTYLGTRWEPVQLAKGRIMLVNHAQIPRALSLVPPNNPAPKDIHYCAGLLPPSTQDENGALVSTGDKGSRARLSGTTASHKLLSPSYSTRLKIRAVNLETGAESKLVDLYNDLHAAVAAESEQLVKIRFDFDDGTSSAGGPPYTVTTPNLLSKQYAWVSGDMLIISAPMDIAGTYYISSWVGNVLTLEGTFGAGWAVARNAVTAEVLTGLAGLVRSVLRCRTALEDLLIPVDSKWTHIEVWRTDASGATYYREALIELNEEGVDSWQSPGGAGNYEGVLGIINGQNYDSVPNYPIHMQSTQLTGQSPLLSMDISAGGLPPVCRKAVSVQGVTVFLGAASVASKTIEVDTRSFYMHNASYVHGTRTLTRNLVPVNSFAKYTHQAGDRLMVYGSTVTKWAEFPISSRPDADTLVLTAPGPGVDFSSATCCILRAVTVKWPVIDDDELVYHSRTDKFAPESVVGTPVRLSSIGDTFKNAVVCNGAVVVVMASGVHLLFPTAAGLDLETIAAAGYGTPWPDSVVVYGDMAVWATPEGPVICLVTKSANDQGKRGTITYLDRGFMRSWFEQARQNGDDIDAGVDPGNACIRFRRKPADGSEPQSLQYCFATQRWVVLRGDSGDRFVTSRFVGTDDATEERLYSVSEKNLFEENYYRTPHPYKNLLYQGTINVTDIILTTPVPGTHRITRSLTQYLFSKAMAGDAIWFRSPGTARDGVYRVITAVDQDGACDWIEFAEVPGLTAGDEFIIGAVRTRVRWPAFEGREPESVKTLGLGEAVTVKALPGARAETAGSGYGHDGKFSLRTYRGHSEDPMDERLSEIPVYNDNDDVGYKDSDRCSAIEGQGQDLQLEIEMLDAAQDWRLQQVNAIIREEGAGQTQDASATE